MGFGACIVERWIGRNAIRSSYHGRLEYWLLGDDRCVAQDKHRAGADSTAAK
jgi:hypothetical protein